ncbi:Fic family protein [Mycoplasma todarodis]|uniref:Fic family protein n=1 Tax=Mycoplasma todarodis TaxID=1937191 RepID=UPI003B2EDCD8
MKAQEYKKINKSSTSGPDSFLRNLRQYYGEKEVRVQLTNEVGSNFVYFNNGLKDPKQEFKALIKQALERREVEVQDYLETAYITSEINSSLKAEGVHSSRKIVDQVLKAKKSGETFKKDTIQRLVANYYESIRFIISGKEVTKRNIFILYGLLTSDLSEVIEEGNFYREGVVSIGEDQGMESTQIESKMNELIEFINFDEMNDDIQTKAIISHYVFENIHPYYDYNGRMGRLLHLWILRNHSTEEFWKLVFLSESIYAFKGKLDTTFRRITKAKKNKANIDLTYFVSNMYEIFNEHTKAYIKMKDLVVEMDKKPSRHLRLFIIDLLCSSGEFNKWYDISEFKRRYEDYSKTVYDRVLKEIKDSGLFEIRGSRPIQFRLIQTK